MMKQSLIKSTLVSLCLVCTPMLWAGKITVNNGASLNGTGIIIGDLDVKSGGRVVPWTTCLSVSDANFEPGSELQFSIEGNVACTDQSQLIVNGEIDLNDATLNATTNNYTMQVWDEYVFIDNDASETILSPFDAIGENSTYTIDGELLYASYFSGDGNDFSLLFKFIYPIGGTVSGLAAGNEVFLQNGSGEITSVNSNGAYQFPTDLDDGSAYSVSVINQPSTPNQTCTVSNNSGNVSGGAVTDINVSCVTNTYPIGGTVVGLAAGNTATVLNNSGDALILNSNGGFVFSTSITDETTYNVQVSVNPTAPNQTCSVLNGSGMVAGDAVTDVVISCVTNSYTIGGNVSGLVSGNSVVLQNSLTDDLLVNADGSFTFDTEVVDEGGYAVTILTQPTTPNQTCTVTQGSGNVAGTTVTTVDVTCVTNTYTVGGNVSGLAGDNSVVLQNNLSDDLIVSADGSFTFVTEVSDESGYAVTVLTQPTTPNQTCTIMQGSGNVAGNDVTNVSITCSTEAYFVGGDVAGLASGNSLTLQNNISDDLMLSANGVFIFDTALDDKTAFDVTVLDQPVSPNQTCDVTAGSGNIAGDDVVDVMVDCVTNTYSIGGTVSGLLSGEMLKLQNNSGDDLLVFSNGAFSFNTELDDLSDYEVTILSEPTSPIQNCEINGAEGQVDGENISGVLITCDSLDLIFKDGFEEVFME